MARTSSSWTSTAIAIGAGSSSRGRTVSAVGVGVDLVEVSRARAMLADKGAHVFDRLLTPPLKRSTAAPGPIPPKHVAVRLAAKEAVYKALQGSDAARGIGCGTSR